MTETQLKIGLAVLAVAISFLASAWVNAISRLSKGRARGLAATQPKRGALLIRIADDPPLYLTSVLLLMLVARVTATVIFTGLMIRYRVPAPQLIAIVVMSFVLFQLAEIAPRTWVLERLDQVLLLSARPVYVIGAALKPLSVVLISLSRVFLLLLPGRGLPRGPLTSEEEIKSILDVAESEDVIEAGEREMIHSIFDFGDTVVREVMTPRPDMVCIPVGATMNEALELSLKKGYSRVPVIRENIDDVAGIVYQKDLVRKLQNGGRSKPKKVSEAVREAVFVPESKKVLELLREMQRSKTHMSIVMDEYGGTAGLVTMEDLLEEIVGEITDEYDREEPDVVRLDDDTLRISPRLPIEELNEMLHTQLPHEDWDSVGGLVAGTLGRVAAEGDLVNLNGVSFTVEKVKGRRIQQLLVSRAGAGARTKE